MNRLALACARVGLCVCCALGAGRAAASAHPLLPDLDAFEAVAAPAPSVGLEQAGSLAESTPQSDTVLRTPRAVGGMAAGFMARLDHETFKPGTWDNSFFERAGRDLGSPAVLLGGTALFALEGWASGNQEQVETAGLMGLGFLGTSATVQGLKSLTGRPRPDGTDDYSFPSGHAANSFLAAAVLAQEYGGATAVVSYSAATLIGASRVAGGRHHFTDVLVGAAIGQLFGLLATSLDK